MSGREGGGAGAVEGWGGAGGGEHAAYQLDACERRDVCSAQISNVLISSSSRKPWRPGPDHNSDQTSQRGRQRGRGRAGRVTVRARDQPRPALSSFFPMKTAKHCCLLPVAVAVAHCRRSTVATATAAAAAAVVDVRWPLCCCSFGTCNSKQHNSNNISMDD